MVAKFVMVVETNGQLAAKCDGQRLCFSVGFSALVEGVDRSVYKNLTTFG